MVKLLRLSAFIVVLIAIGVGSFWAARALRGNQLSAEARTGPPPTEDEVSPRLEPAKPPPPYEGELNGFTFYSPAQVDPQTFYSWLSPKCTHIPGIGNNIKYVDEETGRVSRLNFEVGYLPQGAQLNNVSVSACEGDVINIQRDYSIGKKAALTIFRKAGPAFVKAALPRENMEPKTIGNRPAIIMHPTLFIKAVAIHLRDANGVWTIAGRGITLEELIKVAEGVR